LIRPPEWPAIGPYAPSREIGLYRYIWRTSGREQTGLAVLSTIIFLLDLAPLELQRRIVNEAIHDHSFDRLFIYQIILQPWMVAVALALFAPQFVFVPAMQNAINRRTASPRSTTRGKTSSPSSEPSPTRASSLA
jgi:hypothetical protein